MSTSRGAEAFVERLARHPDFRRIVHEVLAEDERPAAGGLDDQPQSVYEDSREGLVLPDNLASTSLNDDIPLKLTAAENSDVKRAIKTLRMQYLMWCVGLTTRALRGTWRRHLFAILLLVFWVTAFVKNCVELRGPVEIVFNLNILATAGAAFSFRYLVLERIPAVVYTVNALSDADRRGLERYGKTAAFICALLFGCSTAAFAVREVLVEVEELESSSDTEYALRMTWIVVGIGIMNPCVWIFAGSAMVALFTSIKAHGLELRAYGRFVRERIHKSGDVDLAEVIPRYAAILDRVDRTSALFTSIVLPFAIVSLGILTLSAVMIFSPSVDEERLLAEAVIFPIAALIAIWIMLALSSVHCAYKIVLADINGQPYASRALTRFLHFLERSEACFRVAGARIRTDTVLQVGSLLATVFFYGMGTVLRDRV